MKKADLTFRSITLSHPDSGNVRKSAPQLAPALLTRISSLLSRLSISVPTIYFIDAGNVAGDRDTFAGSGQFVGEGVAGFGFARGDVNPGAILNICARDHFADTAASAGHQSDFAPHAEQLFDFHDLSPR